MNKYDPLREFLRRQDRAELDLSFEDVEEIIGRLLPPSADSARWWANVHRASVPHVQRRAWYEAGYEAFPVVEQERVVFRKRGSVACLAEER